MTQDAGGIGVQLMIRKSILLTFMFAMLAVSPLCRAQSQEPSIDSAIEGARAEPTKTTLVTGLPGFKDGSNGSLTVEKGNLQFVHSKSAIEIPGPSITDVVTGSDSQRVIRGKAGTVSMFGPYGSGRFLSLFRSKLDTLTIQYRDGDGGLHGVIFTMAVGKAELLKQQLIAQGAHTTIATESSAKHETSKLYETTEQNQ
jgi:hypothetical protein